jgi:5-(carboxyamino)imidazole ribonucleotide synthase
MSHASSNTPVLPGDWLGTIGGGQLGRMFCQAAQSMGYKVAVLDPDVASPAGAVAELHICAAYTDTQALKQLSQRCKVVTTEFENVPAQSLQALAETSAVHPSADAVAIVQDRISEKAFIESTGVPVAPHKAIACAADLEQAPDHLFPGILKVARLGYDGKGQARVSSRQEAAGAFQEFGQAPCVLEALLPLAGELSVVLARSASGQVVSYLPPRNEHRNGILAVSTAAEGLHTPERVQQAALAARHIAGALDYIGVMCVEFFVLADGKLVANEIAPRPHNSGHYTMNACVVSQFEQQVRAVAGMPLGDTHSVTPAIMLNLLGDIWFDPQTDQLREPDWAGVLQVPGACLHLYGKAQARKGRKMGHVNIVGDTLDQVTERAAQVAKVLGIRFEP